MRLADDKNNDGRHCFGPPANRAFPPGDSKLGTKYMTTVIDFVTRRIASEVVADSDIATKSMTVVMRFVSPWRPARMGPPPRCRQSAGAPDPGRSLPGDEIIDDRQLFRRGKRAVKGALREPRDIQ
jgi:hypothetical protein